MLEGKTRFFMEPILVVKSDSIASFMVSVGACTQEQVERGSVIGAMPGHTQTFNVRKDYHELANLKEGASIVIMQDIKVQGALGTVLVVPGEFTAKSTYRIREYDDIHFKATFIKCEITSKS